MIKSSMLIIIAVSGNHVARNEMSIAQLDAHVAQVRIARKLCGPIALWYSLRRLGVEVDPEEIIARSAVGADGTSLQQILELAAVFGHHGQAVSGDPERLTDLPSPSILVLKPAHAVVFTGVDESEMLVSIFEPAEGRVKNIPIEDLRKYWSGEAIMFGTPQLSKLVFILVVGLTMAVVVLIMLLASHGRTRKLTVDRRANVS